jgi:hypothetical protein
MAPVALIGQQTLSAQDGIAPFEHQTISKIFITIVTGSKVGPDRGCIRPSGMCCLHHSTVWCAEGKAILDPTDGQVE